jgi:hypothetical protein
MTIDPLRDYLGRNTPWLTLHDLQQEVQEIRRLIEEMRTQKAGIEDEKQGDEISQVLSELLLKRLESLEDTSRRMMPVEIMLPQTTIYLEDSHKVDRLNEDERLAGFWLALCTLFIGAWLENKILSSSSAAIVLSAALAFGVAAGYYYWRTRTAWREMKNQQRTLLWPPQDSHSKGGDR